MVTKFQKQLVSQIRTHAKENENTDGWCKYVEAMSDSEIAETIGRARTLRRAVGRTRTFCKKLIDEDVKKHHHSHGHRTHHSDEKEHS